MKCLLQNIIVVNMIFSVINSYTKSKFRHTLNNKSKFADIDQAFFFSGNKKTISLKMSQPNCQKMLYLFEVSAV